MADKDLTKYELALSKYNTDIKDSDVKSSLEKLLEKNLEKNDTQEVKKLLFNCVDLTTLQTTDSQESVLKFTEKVNQFDDEYPELGHVAAICVYPNFAKIVSQTLEVDDVQVTCVSGGFPSSQTYIEVKIAETSMALYEGATEIDIVINVGSFLSGDYESMCEEVEELKEVCKDHHMKVILETGALKTAANIKKASILSMYSGADFIKTSTGKLEPAATPEAAYVMCQAIKEYYLETGRKVGFKPAGGLSTVKDALIYYTIVKEILGEEWLNNKLFRLGTSRLTNLLLSEIKGTEINFF
ncbi:deoxyribose-phosphate aldolase [Bacteroides propionicifaciens]|uniref:deoxyribose-phosphate aldolase n=1 Tax=Bacteroides propionicifaciens TaxID=392838 RepID=UPI0003675303|nr:deoxyribose-phosphate aldolase [Bacteroides propionicifaciens]